MNSEENEDKKLRRKRKRKRKKNRDIATIQDENRSTDTKGDSAFIENPCSTDLKHTELSGETVEEGILSDVIGDAAKKKKSKKKKLREKNEIEGNKLELGLTENLLATNLNDNFLDPNDSVQPLSEISDACGLRKNFCAGDSERMKRKKRRKDKTATVPQVMDDNKSDSNLGAEPLVDKVTVLTESSDLSKDSTERKKRRREVMEKATSPDDNQVIDDNILDPGLKENQDASIKKNKIHRRKKQSIECEVPCTDKEEMDPELVKSVPETESRCKLHEFEESIHPYGSFEKDVNRKRKRKRERKKKREDILEQELDKKAADYVRNTNDEICLYPKTALPIPIRRKLLVLDVNGLLADIHMPVPKNSSGYLYVCGRAVFKRPFCHDFLEFCFQNFDIGIWSSRSKRVIDSIVDRLLGNLKDKLLFCWNMQHCTQTGFRTLENDKKPLVCKELRTIWESNDHNLPWKKGDYDESNTLLLDDSPYKALLNPLHTAIFPNSYGYLDASDASLGPEGDIRMYLKGLLESENVQEYVEQHSFGQRAIDKQDKSWNFYSKVLHKISQKSKLPASP